MEGKKGKFCPAAPLLCICGCMRIKRLEALKMDYFFKNPQPANLPNTTIAMLPSTLMAINVTFDIVDFLTNPVLSLYH
jgi:hypothetical protein